MYILYNTVVSIRRTNTQQTHTRCRRCCRRRCRRGCCFCCCRSAGRSVRQNVEHQPAQHDSTHAHVAADGSTLAQQHTQKHTHTHCDQLNGTMWRMGALCVPYYIILYRYVHSRGCWGCDDDMVRPNTPFAHCALALCLCLGQSVRRHPHADHEGELGVRGCGKRSKRKRSDRISRP